MLSLAESPPLVEGVPLVVGAEVATLGVPFVTGAAEGIILADEI